MEEREGAGFDPIAMRAKLAERNEGFAEFLKSPLYADEAEVFMPGFTAYHTYRGLAPEQQDPPGLNSGDFAEAFRGIPHPGGILSIKRGE
jgi:hypothetical protein